MLTFLFVWLDHLPHQGLKTLFVGVPPLQSVGHRSFFFFVFFFFFFVHFFFYCVLPSQHLRQISVLSRTEAQTEERESVFPCLKTAVLD